MPSLRQRKRDLSVWAPPPPLPASSAQASTAVAGAAGPASAGNFSSAFQQRFANRTAMVGKDGANAQLGVAAAPASTDAALSAVQPKRGTLAPLRASGGTAFNESSGAPPSSSALGKRKSQMPVRIRITAPSEGTHCSSPLRRKEGIPASSATAAMHHGSGPTLSSPAAARMVERAAVRCVLAPSAAAATAVTSCDGPGNGKTVKSGSSVALLRHDTALRRCPSTASLSTGTPVASSHMPNNSKAVAAASASISLSPTPSGGDLFSVPLLSRLVKSPIHSKQNLPTTTTPTAAAAATASSTLSHHVEQTKADLPQATRPNQERCDSSPSSSTAAASETKKRAGYRPYSISAYMALMADIAGRKAGGLGPSDTDAQRAAREKRERAKAYAKHAMEVARASLMVPASCADDGEGDTSTIIIAPASLSARSSSSDATTTTATTATTSASTSRSASVMASEYHRRRQGGARHAAPTPRSTPRQQTNSKPSRAATPQPHASPTAVDAGDIMPPHSGAESINAKSPKAAQAPSSAPRQRSTAVAAFSVAAAPRRQTMQARRRRERALTYAREVSQKSLRLTPAACEGGDATCSEPRGAVSRTRRAAKRGTADNTDEDDTWLDDSLVISPGAVRATDAPDSGRIQRLQRLLELEALHATKKAAVEVIRRQLRA